MDLKSLSQCYYLQKEIADANAKIKALEYKAVSISAKISAEPIAQGTISDKTAIAGLIADEKEKIIKKKLKLVKEYTRVSRYIDSIDDSLTRLIFRERFIKLKSWNAVAIAVGGNNTSESVKKICYRYLNRHK